VSRRIRWFVALGALVLVPAAPAVAQDGVPVPTATPVPTVTPAPTPAPVAAAVTLRMENVLRGGDGPLALRGRTVRFTGRLSPAPAAGEHVVVRVLRDGRRVGARRVPVQADGTFVMRHRVTALGSLKARALHPRSAALRYARSETVRVRVVRARAFAGDRGPVVRLLQRSLWRMRYAVPRNGVYDAATERAVIAYRKVNRLPRAGGTPRAIYDRVVAGRGAYRVRYPNEGKHLEADLSRQIVALVGKGGRLQRVYTTSSGAPITPTVIGRFRVYRQDAGTNALGMVHSSYFIRGYAVHGYVSVPTYPASHGCLRVPVPDAWDIFRWLDRGDVVIVDRR
jgi:peptidoglycan hydrolase-like protein with peptidoglycan-binding domain